MTTNLISVLSFIILFFCEIQCLNSQVDTSELISTVIIKASSVPAIQTNFVVIYPEEDAFSSNNSSLSDLLVTEGLSFVKTYGLGSIATITARGSSSSQNQVLWNGVSIQNPMLSLSDLSLVNTQLFDRISIQKGNASSLYGTASIGSVINLENQINLDTKKLVLDLDFGIGSLNKWSSSGKLGITHNHITSITQVEFIRAKNEFVYYDNNSSFSKLITNNRLESVSLMQSFKYEIRKGFTIDFHYWKLLKDKEIPATLTQTMNRSWQKDNFDRFMLSIKNQSTNYISEINLSYFDESINYVDSIQNVDALSEWNNFQVSHNIGYYINKDLSLTNKINFQRVSASISNYKNRQVESYLSCLFDLGIEKRNWNFNLANRFEYEIGNEFQIVPTLRTSYEFSQNLSVVAKLGKGFRRPGLNDKYWEPGGNIVLRSEKSLGEEIAIKHNDHFDKWSIKTNVSAYHQLVRDWILWSPSEVTSFWSAQNLAKVRSLGLDIYSTIKKKIDNGFLEIDLKMSFVKANNLKSINLPVINEGDQLIYTPKFRGHLSINYSVNILTFGYSTNYFSDTEGINETVPAYFISNLETTIKPKFMNNKMKISFGIENLWDSDYFVIERRPMPGRLFNMNIKYKV